MYVLGRRDFVAELEGRRRDERIETAARGGREFILIFEMGRAL